MIKPMMTNQFDIKTVTLPTGAGRKPEMVTFAVITDIDLAQAHCDARSHVWIVSIEGRAIRVKVTGKVRRWKRDRSRIEIPVKYGLYEYATLDAGDVANGRILEPLPTLAVVRPEVK